MGRFDDIAFSDTQEEAASKAPSPRFEGIEFSAPTPTPKPEPVAATPQPVPSSNRFADIEFSTPAPKPTPPAVASLMARHGIEPIKPKPSTPVAAPPSDMNAVAETPPASGVAPVPTAGGGVADGEGVSYIGRARDAVINAQPGTPEYDKAMRDYNRLRTLSETSTDAALKQNVAETQEAIARKSYLPAKAALGGLTFGVGSAMFDAIEKKTGVVVTPESTDEEISSALAGFIGSVVSQQGLMRGLGSLANARKMSGIGAFALQRIGGNALSQGVRQLSALASGNTDAKTATRDFMLNFGSAMVSMIPENTMSPGAANAVAQILFDFTVDVAADKYRGRFKDQSFVHWFLTEEIGNLAMSVAAAGEDLRNPKQLLDQQKSIRQLFDKHLRQADESGEVKRTMNAVKSAEESADAPIPEEVKPDIATATPAAAPADTEASLKVLQAEIDRSAAALPDTATPTPDAAPDTPTRTPIPLPPIAETATIKEGAGPINEIKSQGEAAGVTVEPLRDVQAKIDAVPPKADGSVDMEARQRVLDEWKAANQEAAERIEKEAANEGSTSNRGRSSVDRGDIGINQQGDKGGNWQIPLGGKEYIYKSPYRPVLSISASLPQGWRMVDDNTFAVDKPLPSRIESNLQLEPQDPSHPRNVRARFEAFREKAIEQYADANGYDVTSANGTRFVLTDNIDPNNKDRFPYRVTLISEDGAPSGHEIFKDFDEALRFMPWDKQTPEVAMGDSKLQRLPSPLTLTPEGRLAGAESSTTPPRGEQTPTIGDTITAKSHQIAGMVHTGKIVGIDGDMIQIVNQDGAPVSVLRKNVELPRGEQTPMGAGEDSATTPLASLRAKVEAGEPLTRDEASPLTMLPDGYKWDFEREMYVKDGAAATTDATMATATPRPSAIIPASPERVEAQRTAEAALNTADMNRTELRARADELGVTYNPRTPNETLRKLIKTAEASAQPQNDIPPVENTDRPDLEAMTRKQLQDEASRLGVSVRGNKKNLVDRLSRSREGARQKARSFIQTLQNQAGLPDGAMDELSRVDPQTYEQTKTGEIFKKIRESLDTDPNLVSQAEDFLKSPDSPSASKGAVAAALIDKLQADGRWEDESRVAQEYDRQLRESGRFIQSASLVSSLSGKAFMKQADSFWKGHNTDVPEDVREAIRQEYTQARRIADETTRNDAVGSVIEKIASLSPTSWRDFVGSYRYTNMLSNPQSHERNVFGNLMEAFIARPAALLGQSKVKGAVQYTVAAFKGLPNAFSAFADSWRSGKVNQKWYESSSAFRNQFESERTRQGVSKSRTAQALRVVGRLLEAQDKFFSSMIESGETARLVKSGSTPQEAQVQARKLAEDLLYRSRVGEHMNNKDKALAVRALDATGELMESARNHKFIGKPISWFLPFVRTPIKLGEKMIEFSPLGYITHPKGRLSAEDIGRANAGTFVTMAGAALAMSGMTTGQAPKDPEERRLWYDSGRRPWSVLINGKWVPMWYFGPFAAALAFPASVRDTWVDDPSSSSKGVAGKLASNVGSMAKFYTSQTPLQGAGNFLDVVQGRTDISTADSLAFTAGQMVPASGFLRWANQLMIDPVYRRGGSFSQGFMKDYPLTSKYTRPYITSDGTPVARPPSAGLLPFAVGTVDAKKDQERALRNNLLRERGKLNKELDRLVRHAVQGDISEDQVVMWLELAPESEKSRLKTRMNSKFKEWAKEAPIVGKPQRPSRPSLQDSYEYEDEDEDK